VTILDETLLEAYRLAQALDYILEDTLEMFNDTILYPLEKTSNESVENMGTVVYNE
jgi:hypothetical protein